MYALPAKKVRSNPLLPYPGKNTLGRPRQGNVRATPLSCEMFVPRSACFVSNGVARQHIIFHQADKQGRSSVSGWPRRLVMFSHVTTRKDAQAAPSVMKHAVFDLCGLSRDTSSCRAGVGYPDTGVSMLSREHLFISSAWPSFEPPSLAGVYIPVRAAWVQAKPPRPQTKKQSNTHVPVNSKDTSSSAMGVSTFRTDFSTLTSTGELIKASNSPDKPPLTAPSPPLAAAFWRC